MNYLLQDIPVSRIIESGSQFGISSGVGDGVPVAWGVVPTAALGLLLFGIVYNLIIHELHRRGLNDGYVWLEVVVGVGVTLVVASFVVGWPAVLALFVLFAASGLLPAIGDMYRYVRARRAESPRRNNGK